MLGQIGAKTFTTSRVKSWSVLKAKLEIIEMQAHPDNAEIEEILADIPKGEINLNPT